MRRASTLAALCLNLAACTGEPSGGANELAALDAELSGAQAADAVDPQIMAALNDPIMVDPQLAGGSNGDAIRPPPEPYAAPVPHPGVAAGTAIGEERKLDHAPAATPLKDAAARRAITLGALARGEGGRRAACGARLAYSADWAHRLPAALPLHPDARVVEAAGVEGDGCSMRAVSFYVTRPRDQLIDWYYTQARKAGYSADHQADGATHMLAGTTRGGASYIAFFTDRGDGGTDIDLITA